MQVFKKISDLRAFQRRYMPHLTTVEDFDIVTAIGLQQELGKRMLLKHLYLEGIGTVSTVARRVARLRREGVVISKVDHQDARVVSLTVSPAMHKVYLRYDELLRAVAA